MKEKQLPETVTIRTNHWKIPDPAEALDGWIEGVPSDAQVKAARDQASNAQEVWRPDEEAFLLVGQLTSFIGFRVRIQFWDSIMLMLEDEGPFPFECDCRDVVILSLGKHPQAYMVVDSLSELPTPDGYSALRSIDDLKIEGRQLLPVARIYEVLAVTDLDNSGSDKG